MKHHLNIILLTLGAAILTASIMAIDELTAAVRFLTLSDKAEVLDYFSDYFTPVRGMIIPHMNKWFGSAFCIIYAALLIYIIIGIVRFYKCLLRIKKGQLFYSTQGNQFKKAGAAIIIFAKSKYLLFCTTAVLYFDFTIFYKQLPEFLILYLMGKLILLMSHITEKGEFVQQENELTI